MPCEDPRTGLPRMETNRDCPIARLPHMSIPATSARAPCAPTSPAKCRQRFRKLNELVELRLLLRRPIIVVVAVLPPAGRVDAGCLQLRGRTRRDPHFLPCRWNRQRLDPLELLRVRDPPAARIQIAEPASRAGPRPASFPRHLGPDAREFPHYTPARWTRSESSCSRATRPARSYS